jgi:hypothetical protein
MRHLDVLPRECVACDEAREHVVATNHANCTDDEELRDGEFSKVNRGWNVLG